MGSGFDSIPVNRGARPTEYQLAGLPGVVLLAGEVILELAAQRLIILPPAAPLAIDFFLGDCLAGEPRVLRVCWADLDVGVTHHVALMVEGGLGGHEVSVGQP